jgi:hypothetical protein
VLVSIGTAGYGKRENGKGGGKGGLRVEKQLYVFVCVAKKK